jgi:23S rRNA maturation-related 3'-5' exoribonuclease YhaM
VEAIVGATAGASRPITNELRRSVVEDLPEIDDISDARLRDRSIEAWAIALAGSSFRRISDIPGEGNPGVMVLKRGSQDVHLRGVAQLALNIVDHFGKMFPEAVIDHDIVLAGALCHDVGKAMGVRSGQSGALAGRRIGCGPSVAAASGLRGPYLPAGGSAGRNCAHCRMPFARGG